MPEIPTWESDGLLRFVSSLQDKTDKSCYKDFFESKKLDEAKKECEETAEKNQRSAIVYDRKLMEIVHRKVIETKKVEEKKEEVVVPKRRGRKPTIERKSEIPKKKITNDDYFD